MKIELEQRHLDWLVGSHDRSIKLRGSPFDSEEGLSGDNELVLIVTDGVSHSAQRLTLAELKDGIADQLHLALDMAFQRLAKKEQT